MALLTVLCVKEWYNGAIWESLSLGFFVLWCMYIICDKASKKVAGPFMNVQFLCDYEPTTLNF